MTTENDSGIQHKSYKQSLSNRNKNLFYRIRMCPHFPLGKCVKGDNCSFAHSDEQLVHVVPLRKTLLCRDWQLYKCPNTMEECRFSHGEFDLVCNHVFKTSLCQNWVEDPENCPRTDRCHKAHGDVELRARKEKCVVCCPADFVQRKPKSSHHLEKEGSSSSTSSESQIERNFPYVSSAIGHKISKSLTNSDSNPALNPSTVSSSVDNNINNHSQYQSSVNLPPSGSEPVIETANPLNAYAFSNSDSTTSQTFSLPTAFKTQVPPLDFNTFCTLLQQRYKILSSGNGDLSPRSQSSFLAVNAILATHPICLQHNSPTQCYSMFAEDLKAKNLPNPGVGVPPPCWLCPNNPQLQLYASWIHQQQQQQQLIHAHANLAAHCTAAAVVAHQQGHTAAVAAIAVKCPAAAAAVASLSQDPTAATAAAAAIVQQHQQQQQQQQAAVAAAMQHHQTQLTVLQQRLHHMQNLQGVSLGLSTTNTVNTNLGIFPTTGSPTPKDDESERSGSTYTAFNS